MPSNFFDQSFLTVIKTGDKKSVIDALKAVDKDIMSYVDNDENNVLHLAAKYNNIKLVDELLGSFGSGAWFKTNNDKKWPDDITKDDSIKKLMRLYLVRTGKLPFTNGGKQMIGASRDICKKGVI